MHGRASHTLVHGDHNELAGPQRAVVSLNGQAFSKFLHGVIAAWQTKDTHDATVSQLFADQSHQIVNVLRNRGWCTVKANQLLSGGVQLGGLGFGRRGPAKDEATDHEHNLTRSRIVYVDVSDHNITGHRLENRVGHNLVNSASRFEREHSIDTVGHKHVSIKAVQESQGLESTVQNCWVHGNCSVITASIHVWQLDGRNGLAATSSHAQRTDPLESWSELQPREGL
mmetsp:Transcript_53048/g.94671  ORF Transcript_53048/g.94671 Transcript_53048/m.94671 type:complete len:227 (-) Transcript_53048:3182-3862(-)